jgi:hypothetical protein
LASDEWGDLVVLPQDLLDLIGNSDAFIQILGETGHGKTAILRGLLRIYQDQGIPATYEYLPPGATKFRSKPHTARVFLLDEAQRLGKRSWRSLQRSVQRGPRLIWSSHADLMDTHPVSIEKPVTYRLTQPDIESILRRRLEWFALESPPPICFSLDAVAALQEEFGGDLRSMLTYLYAYFQAFPGRGRITRGDLASFPSSGALNLEP